ncbi:uncharacterized protein LOC112588068 isoform X2 [Harpegnathos saltator]|nr:uncharacterized protein LOC112588068 isoform X2 [Harpegnathos saltator]
MFLFLNSMIQYSTFRMNKVTIKIVLEELQRVCDKMKDKNELAIIKKYGNISRRYAFWLTTLAVLGEFGFILMQCWSHMLNFIQPRNISMQHTLLFPMEYLVDQQRYFYLIMLHMNAAVCIGITASLATGTLFIACQKCICGLFIVASYRIKHAIRIDASEKINSCSQNLAVIKIARAVEIHRNAMKFSRFLVNKFQLMLSVLILAGVSSLSLNLFRIFSIMSSRYHNFKELLLPAGYIILIAIYLFLANYIAQDLTDHNKNIFVTAYNVCWYKAPINVQRVILFLLQRGTKEFTVKVIGWLNGSLECFASLTNISISYFTVLYSTQK